MKTMTKRPEMRLVTKLKRQWAGWPQSHFIGNEWTKPHGSKTINVINPATEEALAQIASGDKEDVNKAVNAAREAFERGTYHSWGGRDRGNFLRRLANLIQEHSEELATLECLNNGKPISELRAVDLPMTISVLNYYAGIAENIRGETIDVPGHLVYTRREPMGVVGSITAWNFPLLLLSWKFGPAIACGNTMVHKPPEQAPMTALRFAELCREAGLPAGVFNVVTGDAKAGSALTHHMDVDKVGFTGHYSTGQLVMKAAAESNLKRVSLELGGKSPNIILPDAKLDETIQGIVTGIFFNQGQVCCAGSRLFLPRGMSGVVLKELDGIIAKRKVGDPLDPTTQQGTQINEEQFDKIMGYITKGKEEGATLRIGGERCGDRGYFIWPTVFTDVEDGMTIAKEEIFGPVVCAMEYDSLEEVAARANNTIYGLGAAVFTRDISKAHTLASMLKAGTVWINCYNAFDATVPFGGYKMSGFGRELGKSAIELYTQEKAVWAKL